MLHFKIRQVNFKYIVFACKICVAECTKSQSKKNKGQTYHGLYLYFLPCFTNATTYTIYLSVFNTIIYFVKLSSQNPLNIPIQFYFLYI